MLILIRIMKSFVPSKVVSYCSVLMRDTRKNDRLVARRDALARR